ncbi:MAG: penicillin-binding protein 2 [Candidatus Omnitrophota bacterium]|nr:MAG: penicillin-binding protein 2 [Candidatus Omnitrophota bacterium]
MRVRIFANIILFFFLVLIFGLSYTQVLKHASYKKLSENNRVRVVSLASPRGKIYDRSGNLLVSNRISFDVEVIYQEINDVEKVINLLGDILAMDKELLSKKIGRSRKMPFAPVKIVEDIKKETAIQIEEVRLDLPGVIITTRPLRNYIYKNIFSHAIGYLGKISETELRKFKTYGYHVQDFVGKDGIERRFNDYLRGVDGGLQIEVDNKGQQVKLLAVKEPRAGRDLYLSIDKELQEFCHSLLAPRQGAILAMEPSTGAILALVSQPDFDPNVFVSPDNFKKIRNLLDDSRAFPMLNRAISGTYQPGSVFKAVVAAAALDSGRFDDKKTFSCKGSFPLGKRAFHCWKERGHGTVDITGAIKESCNVFFYQLGVFLGADEISRYAFKLGLGRMTGIDLPGEVSGLVPTPRWKKSKFKTSWFKGETANYAIGQGHLLVTPMQILRFIGAIANKNKLLTPFIVERIEDVKLRHPEPRDIKLKDEALETIKEALRMVVNARRGTGLYARSKEVIISGKTGTAQNPEEKPHAWFAGFAPFENPRICVVVFIEHGGKGGLEPAQFAKKIVEKAKELELL